MVAVEEVAGVADGAARAEDDRLLDVVEAHAEGAPVAERFADGLGLVVQVDDDVVEPVAGQVLGDVADERPPPERDCGLGAVNRQRPQPRPVARGKNHRTHRGSSVSVPFCES